MRDLLTKTAIISLLYFLLSVLVLNVFDEPSLSAAIWPAAGVGVGAVLLWGKRAIPGIVLGEVLIRFYLSGTDWLTHFSEGYWIEIGLVLIALFRAVFAAWLASRVVRFPDPLIRYRNVFLFFFTGGVVATLLSTMLYMALRYSTGNLPPGSLMQNLFLWWAGDAVGVLLFTPLMLLFFAKPRRIWRPRLVPVAIPIVVVLGLMVLLLQVVRNQEERRIVDMLKIKTTYLARALEQKLNWQSELLYLYKSHFPLNGHRPSDSESFRRFSRRAMTRFPQLKELIWVQSANAEEFTPGQTPVFTGLDDHQPAFSASGDSIETLKKALRIGSNEKHEGIFARNVMPVPGLPGDFVSMLSIYQHSKQKAVGQLLSVFDLKEVVNGVIANIGFPDVSVMVTDQSDEKILYQSLSPYDDSMLSGMTVSVPLNTGFESPWQLQLVPHVNYFKNNFSWSAWGILSGGLAFASFLGIGLLGSTGRTFLTEQEVRKRTRELDEANKALAVSRDKYESLVQTQPVILWRVDIDKDRFIFVSNEAQRVLGYDIQDWFTVPQFWKAITHEEDRFGCEKIIAEGIAHKTQFTMEHRVYDRFGEIRWIRNVIRVIREQGRPVELVGLMIDITQEKLAQKKLEISEQRFRTLFDYAYEAIVIIDLESKLFVEANEKALALYGMSSDDLGKKGPLHFSPPRQPDGRPSREQTEKHVQIVKKEGHAQFEWVHINAAGEEILCEINLVDMPSSGQNLIRGSIFDITKRRRHEENLRIAATTFETHDAIIIADRQGVTLQVNQAFCQMTGYREGEAVGTSAFNLLLPKGENRHKEEILKQLAAKGRWEGEIWCRKKNGKRFLAWHTITGVRDDNGKITHFVSVFSDVTEKKAAENKIRKLAYTDPLTALPNRQYFQEKLEKLFNQSNQAFPYAAIIYIDLDRFKVLNDSKGHYFGDQFLREVGRRIRKALGSQDICARLAGDEFVILTQFFELERSAQAYARHLASMIKEQLSEAFVIDGYEHHSSASLGVRVFNLEEGDPQLVLQQADTAMYRSKQGRNRITFFEKEMIQDANTRLHIEDSLRKAVAQNNLTLYYQPIVDRDRTIVSVEALARWKIASGHFINPEVFIPLAEEIGIIDKVGEWVLNEACAQMRAWLDEGKSIRSIAINVSSKQFHNPGFGEEIQIALDKYDLEPEHLTVEITEGTAIDDLETALAQMNRLKLLGVQLAMDDFGTGYSSLAYLRQMPLNQLKIDKSFVRDAMQDKSARVIIETIIDMGRHLDLEVVAEGVETAEQFAFLRNTGCSRFQGYLFYRPAKPQHLFRSLQAET